MKRTINVLVVEDEEYRRKTWREWLNENKKYNVHVFYASSQKKLSEMLLANKYKDAVDSAFKLDKIQPSCKRIGYSIGWYPQLYKTGSFKDTLESIFEKIYNYDELSEKKVNKIINEMIEWNPKSSTKQKKP